ncbi:ATPase PAAT isoform X2 [Phycodurus eques]|uniref:ATPase PAAT isoform X2 n=1 Tax=Phycodurus eques TaxID=693459 RepID=UPI002ACD52FE|nr:ATPase PAAT isoform X2 [Phycodurus eques]
MSLASVAVKIGAAWQCRPEGRRLADVVQAFDDGDGDEEHEPRQRLGDGGVLLERADGAAAGPCVLTLSCGPAAISRLTLVSEARTMEVYLPTGEYCATVRGDEQDHVRHGDRGPFYRKQLSLEGAPSSCDVKLLSLSGRSSVLLCGAVVGLRPPRPGPAREGGAVDLRRVRSLVDEMGAGLSPGAQSLMDKVRLQQKVNGNIAQEALSEQLKKTEIGKRRQWAPRPIRRPRVNRRLDTWEAVPPAFPLQNRSGFPPLPTGGGFLSALAPAADVVAATRALGVRPATFTERLRRQEFATVSLYWFHWCIPFHNICYYFITLNNWVMVYFT